MARMPPSPPLEGDVSDDQIAVTLRALKEITLFANQPLKRILPDDDWPALQITDADLVALAAGLRDIARTCNKKAKITPGTLTDETVRGAVEIVLKQAGLGEVDDSDADDLIVAAKKQALAGTR
jgi:hypothetical protein